MSADERADVHRYGTRRGNNVLSHSICRAYVVRLSYCISGAPGGVPRNEATSEN